MEYIALIKWNDCGDIQNVRISTKSMYEVIDDTIFHFFDSEADIIKAMHPDVHNFVILNYQPLN